jgi:hypothetical protein
MAAAARYFVLAFVRDPDGHIVLGERLTAVSERTAVAAARAFAGSWCGAAVIEQTGLVSRILYGFGYVSNAVLPKDDHDHP